MFWGEYAHQIDKKGRLIIPARYRAKLNDRAILTRGLDHNLVIYPEHTWEQVTQQIHDLPITHPTSRALRRLLFSGAIELSLDRQGRILLPPHLRSYASLEDKILLVGMETYIELWEPTQWYSTLDSLTNILADIESPLSLSL